MFDSLQTKKTKKKGREIGFLEFAKSIFIHDIANRHLTVVEKHPLLEWNVLEEMRVGRSDVNSR